MYKSIYLKKLAQHKIKNTYDKTDLLIDDYKIGEEINLKIYYAPFDHLNHNAKIIIVGITPGWSQTKKAFKVFSESFNQNNLSEEDSLNQVKKMCSFAGVMRNNLVQMLDELGLHSKLNIISTPELFDSKSDLLHSTSYIKYPVFYKSKNYNGKTPLPKSSELLTRIIDNIFIDEINTFNKKLIIPLGKSSSNVLQELQIQGRLSNNIILENFPHPSGANGHRKKQFAAFKTEMTEKIKSLDFS